jgi:Domain of unknown function (DUF4157)
MADSPSTAIPEAAKATSTAHPPVQDRNVAAEMESDRSSMLGERTVRAIGGGSPEAPPERFAGALGQMSKTSQVGMLRQLQRSYGNSYVGHIIQAKLTLGQSGDRYEQEADQIADRVMRMPDQPSITHELSVSSLNTDTAQRQCTACKEEKKLQRQGNGSMTETSATAPPIVGEVLNSPGHSLDPMTRAFMEPRFGYDFSRVRVHTDVQSDDAARSIQARAFTVDQNIVFGQGQYRPESHDGRQLIAHELTHVIQQSSTGDNHRVQSHENPRLSPVSPISQPVQQRQPTNLVQRQPSDAGMPVSDESYLKQVNCLVRNGLGYGGMRSAGVITPEEIKQVNQYCREKEDTGYKDDIVPTDDENRQVLTGEIVTQELVDELEKLYLDTVDQLAGKPLDNEQLTALNSALQWLMILDRPPARTHFSSLISPLQSPNVGSKQLITPATGMMATTMTLPWALAGGGGAVEGGAVAGSTIAEGGALATGGVVVLVAAAAFIVGYALHKLFEYAGQDRPVIPDATEQVKKAMEDIIRARNPRPIPVPKPEPEPEPEPRIDPYPLPDPDQRRKRKCPYPTGLTPNDPIQIIWFKPVHDSFYPRYLEIMNGILDRDDPDTHLPDETPVGVKTEFWPRLGKVMQLIPQPRTGKQGEYKEDLAHWGYVWGKTMQPDHVQDLDWEGPDAYGNLWPYEASTNQSAGSSQNLQQPITFCLTEYGPQYVGRRIVTVKGMLYGRYFEISRFLIHS